MRLLALSGLGTLVLGLAALVTAESAVAAPLGGVRTEISPHIRIGFGYRCRPRTRVVRRVVVRRPVVRRVYTRPVYYRPVYYRPYYRPTLHIGFGYGPRYHRHRHYHRHRGHHHGSRRVIGRRR